MDRRILNVRVTQPVIDRLDSLARDVGYSRAELAGNGTGRNLRHVAY